MGFIVRPSEPRCCAVFICLKLKIMPRVHTQKANKAYPYQGIEKGQTYYWWKFRYSGKIRSAVRPRASQLTQSNFLSQIYAIGERIEDFDCNESEDLQHEIEDLTSELELLRDECEESRENMPEQLQDTGSGEILQNRIESIEEMVGELEAIDCEAEIVDSMDEYKNILYQGE